jgi:hypothetical protein
LFDWTATKREQLYMRKPGLLHLPSSIKPLNPGAWNFTPETYPGFSEFHLMVSALQKHTIVDRKSTMHFTAGSFIPPQALYFFISKDSNPILSWCGNQALNLI